MKYLEATTMITALIGAILMSFGWYEAFYFFLASNVSGMVFFWGNKMKWMVALQVVFMFTSLNGIYQNLL